MNKLSIMFNIVLYAEPDISFALSFLFIPIIIVIVAVILWCAFSPKNGSICLRQLIYSFIRDKQSPDDGLAVLSLLSTIKALFRENLKAEDYEKFSNWSLVHEIANRYALSFDVNGKEYSCTVIADKYGGIQFVGMDWNSLGKL